MPPAAPPPWILHAGDNLAVLRRLAPAGVDLVYLDPPFNSRQVYPLGRAAAAFTDVWPWDAAAAAGLETFVAAAAPDVGRGVRALADLLGPTPLLAYLGMLAPRLAELRRVLKPTGSLFLHADPTAVHYLKVLLDLLFGAENYRNAIAWKRSQTRSTIRRVFRRAHDVLLFYSRSPQYHFQLQHRPLAPAAAAAYRRRDARGAFRLVPLLVSGRRRGATGQAWRGIDPGAHGRHGMHWITVPANLERYDREGRIAWPERPGGLPQLKYYLADNPGVPVSDFWDDVPHLGAGAAEAVGYPTQKPEALLARIVNAASRPGDVVLDPFCGSGTALVAAVRLGRRAVGIDANPAAVAICRRRLEATGPPG